MKKNRPHRVCPVESAGKLDSRIRRWLQNPRKILGRYIKEGMTVLDVGCGPGFFAVAMAEMVGRSGRVIAADLQEGMLAKVTAKVRGTEFSDRILLHRCEDDKIGVSEMVDFILACYVVHELPDQDRFFKEMYAIANPGGQVLIVEPPFHVSKKAFGKTIQKSEDAGFRLIARPKMFFSQAMMLQKD